MDRKTLAPGHSHGSDTKLDSTDNVPGTYMLAMVSSHSCLKGICRHLNNEQIYNIIVCL